MRPKLLNEAYYNKTEKKAIYYSSHKYINTEHFSVITLNAY